MRSGPKRRCDAACRDWGPGVTRREGGVACLTQRASPPYLGRLSRLLLPALVRLAPVASRADIPTE